MHDSPEKQKKLNKSTEHQESQLNNVCSKSVCNEYLIKIKSDKLLIYLQPKCYLGNNFVNEFNNEEIKSVPVFRCRFKDHRNQYVIFPILHPMMIKYSMESSENH